MVPNHPNHFLDSNPGSVHMNSSQLNQFNHDISMHSLPGTTDVEGGAQSNHNSGNNGGGNGYYTSNSGSGSGASSSINNRMFTNPASARKGNSNPILAGGNSSTVGGIAMMGGMSGSMLPHPPHVHSSGHNSGQGPGKKGE